MESGNVSSGGNDRLTLKRVCCLQLIAVIIFVAGVASGLLIGLFYYHGTKYNGNGKGTLGTASQNSNGTKGPMVETNNDVMDNSNDEIKVKDSTSFNPVTDRRYEDMVFAPLTAAEMSKAAEFLLQQGTITTVDAASYLYSNFILYQVVDVPEKTKVLKFLDKNGPKPRRYARVTVQRGAIASPDIMEYKVGPLDSVAMTATPLMNPGDVHFNSRPYDMVEVGLMYDILQQPLDILAPLIAESFDGAKYPDDLYLSLFNGPPSTSGKERHTRWLLRFRAYGKEFEVDTIDMLPLSGTIHNSGINSSQWWVDDFHYLNQGPFDNATQLMEAYNSDRIRKVKLKKCFRNTLRDRIFPSRDTSLPLRDKADIPGARTYNPGGPRYTVDGTHVKWLGWSFHIGGNQIRGPALFDVKFLNTRIVYELAVNDITLNYAMDTHAQNNIIYADATYSILGSTPVTIIKGIDCPDYGTVLNTTAWRDGPVEMPSICIFEADGQEALWRHAGLTYEAGLRHRYLVVRVPAVIGNYDYTFEFHFFLDGKLLTKVVASGFILAAFWDENDPKWGDKTRNPFGYRISDHVTGPIHDHMFGFKVDMDIIDRNNTFQVIKWKAGSHLDALRSQNASINKVPGYFIYNETRYVEWEKVTKEVGIQHTEEQQFWVVVNEHETNKWGVERGYQIVPLATGSQNLKTHPLLQALSFTKYHCAVTKRREDEPSMTSIYDVNRMDNPKHHLDKQINGEDIVDEDIVNWVTVGFLHVPIAEDMPMTTRVETGFLLKPFNFFDRTASFDMPQYTSMKDGSFSESEPLFEQCP